MSRSKVVILVAVPAVIFVGITIAGLIRFRRAAALMDDLRVYEPAPFATAADIPNGVGVPLPPEARNIRVAGWSQWIAHESYLRFEAPVPVCLQHAAKVLPDETLLPVPANVLANIRPVQPGIFKDFSWFDLTTAQNVVGAGGGGSQQPQIWVDQKRGVFYYRLMD
jgi:hypothetical protein